MEVLRTKIVWLWGTSIVLLIITLAAVYYKIHNGPELIAIHYNVIVGVDAVANKNNLFKIPATGLVISIINYTFARLQRFDHTLLPFLAALVTVIANVMLLMAALFLFKVS